MKLSQVIARAQELLNMAGDLDILSITDKGDNGLSFDFKEKIRKVNKKRASIAPAPKR